MYLKKMNLAVISLILGFTGCIFVISSFVSQLYEIYKTKSGKGTSWGMIWFQICTSFCFGANAAINMYIDGILNAPLFIANVTLLFLFVVMIYLKKKYDKEVVVI
tara:strand:- start:148 stop:462 length:315 start_codon:yes stop_codon:yes gene_type:complete